MRIELTIAFGLSSLAHITTGQYGSYNCGPCIPMMPCPCPMAGYTQPMMMQAQQPMIMQAPPMIMQAVATQPAVKPCNVQSVAVSSSESSTTNSVTGPTINTGDISSVLKEIMRAELTGRWSTLMEAISNFNSQSSTNTVTQNFYTQHNHAEISQNWFVFIQSLIEKIERLPVRSPQDDHNLQILLRLRDKPIIEEIESSINVNPHYVPPPLIEDVPEPQRGTIIAHGGTQPTNLPLAVIPPLAIGWIPSSTDLIPVYANRVANVFDPKSNPLVEYLGLLFGSLCDQDSLCRSGAESLARVVVFLNYVTKGTGTFKLPNRHSLRDWVTVGGPAQHDVYIELLRDSLNKFHNTFCLGEARQRCNDIQPTLITFLTKMLSLETDFADKVRSFVIILMTNGSNSLNWDRIKDMAKPSQSKQAGEGSQKSKTPSPGPSPPGGEIPGADAAVKKILAILPSAEGEASEKKKADTDKKDDTSDKVQIIVNNFVNQSEMDAGELAKWNSLAPKDQKNELLAILGKTVTGLMIIPSTQSNGVVSTGLMLIDPSNVAKSTAFLMRLADEEDNEQRLPGTVLIPMDEYETIEADQGRALAGQMQGMQTLGKPDLTVATPKTATLLLPIDIDDQPADSGKGITKAQSVDSGTDGQQVEDTADGKLVLYKPPKTDFAVHLKQFMKPSVPFVIPKQSSQDMLLPLAVRGSSDERRERSSTEKRRGKSTRNFSLNAAGAELYTKLHGMFETFCESGVAKFETDQCKETARSAAYLIAYVDQETGKDGTNSLSSAVGVLKLTTNDAEYNRLVGDALSRSWSRFCNGEEERECQRIIRGASVFLVMLGNSSEEGWRRFIEIILTRGSRGLQFVVPRAEVTAMARGKKSVRALTNSRYPALTGPSRLAIEGPRRLAITGSGQRPQSGPSIYDLVRDLGSNRSTGVVAIWDPRRGLGPANSEEFEEE